MWLPFASFKNIYPFYRYGMFAEIDSSNPNQDETFEIYYFKGNTKYKFSAPLIGMNASTFNYLKRNYYYRNQSKKLLRTVINRIDNSEDFRWEFYRKSPNTNDSTLLVIIPAKDLRGESKKELP